MNKALILLACFAFLVVLSGGVSVAINVSSCQAIISPDEYMLTQNHANSSTCITIESSDVVFDGAGYTIDGTMNEVKLYERALSVPEMANAYNLGRVKL